MPEEKKTEQEQQQPNEAGVEEDANAETDQEQKPDGEQQEGSEAEGEKEAEAGDEDSEDEGSDDQSDEDEDEEFDPERAKAKIAKANDEAKNLRSRLREAEEALKNAKSPEEVDEIVQQMTKDRETSERDLLVENVALKFKLPEKAQKRLAGNTREELEADAKELAELFGTDEDDDDLTLEGGLDPRSREEGDGDPRSLAQRYGHRRKR